MGGRERERGSEGVRIRMMKRMGGREGGGVVKKEERRGGRNG